MICAAHCSFSPCFFEFPCHPDDYNADKSFTYTALSAYSSKGRAEASIAFSRQHLQNFQHSQALLPSSCLPRLWETHKISGIPKPGIEKPVSFEAYSYFRPEMPPIRRAMPIDVEEIKHLAFLFIMFIACWWLDEIIFDLIPVRKRHTTTCYRSFCKKWSGHL